MPQHKRKLAQQKEKAASTDEKLQEITRDYLEGDLTTQARYSEVIKVWTNTLMDVVVLLLLTGAGILGITSFLMAMIFPPFQFGQ